MKKILSFVLCAVTAFSFLSGTFFTESPFDISVVSEAAAYNKAMLPYCYRKLGDEEKLAYLKMRTAFIDCRDSLEIEIPIETADKLAGILMHADVLTNFNFPVGDNAIEYYYYEDTGMTTDIMFKYLYSKKDYDRMIEESDKAAEKIIAQFKKDASDYEKIKLIHDSIINKTEYYNNKSTSSIYDALVTGSAKCDGYTHAFDYICAKAGILSASVTGYTKDRTSDDEFHIWNKVYCDKKWYNVDVTWDDPECNLNENLTYKYFMVSDKTIETTHVQLDRGFYVPEAKSEGADYYKKYGFYARSLTEARDVFADKIAEAAKEGKHSVTVRLSDEALYNTVTKRFEDTNDLFDILGRASQKTGGRIITDGFSYEGDDSGMYTYTVYFYSPGSRISDYYTDTSQVDGDTVSFLKGLGLKEE